MDGKVIGTTTTSDNEYKTLMALACELYQQGAWAECFRLLLKLSAKGVKTTSLFYNEALCVLQADKVDKAIEYLEKALACLKNARREQEKPTGLEDVVLALYQQQCESAQYCFPMSDDEVEHLPTYARERILRLLIDLCARQNDGARVKTLAGLLAGKHFDNIEKALLQTSTKEN